MGLESTLGKIFDFKSLFIVFSGFTLNEILVNTVDSDGKKIFLDRTQPEF